MAVTADRKLNLLLVDDRPENLLALEGLLSDLGHNLVRARSGAEALKHLLQDEYALLLLDVQMPEMDGYETARLIRGRSRSKHVPIIFITAINQTEEHISCGYAAGAMDYLLKPVRPEVLKAKVTAFAQLAQAQAGIRKYEETLALLDALLVSAPIGLAFLDRGLRHVRINAALAACTGRPAEEIVGRTVWEVAPDFAPRVAPYFRQVLETGEPLLGLELRGEIGATSDTERHFLVNYYPVRTRGGEMLGVGVTSMDITHLKQIEAELRRTNGANEAYLAMLGHELRNPLAAITTASYLLNQVTLDSAQAKRQMAVIDRQAKHLTRMVDDLLNVARISSGKLKLRTERLDFRQVIRQTQEDTRALIEMRQQALTLDVPSEPLWVNGDPVRLSQVLVNLLTNAANYTEPGGHVWITAAQEEQELVVRVRDSGVGISPEVLPHIFEPFFQANRALERSPGGLGIGLSAARSLVQLHGGTLQAFSAGEGCGAELVIRLPLTLATS